MPASNPGRNVAARAFVVTGRVQGVGYRPFVLRLALKHSLTGSVRNLSGQVLIHAEGEIAQLSRFEAELVSAAPPLARPHIESVGSARPKGCQGFEIGQSRAEPEADIHLPPDQFVCADCLAELRDPSNRRYRYPFITCTQCGPRYTLIETLPYDRCNTSMAAFDLCPACRTEYENPADRRFHAEPLGCSNCGPALAYKTVGVEAAIPGDEPAIAAAGALLRAGGILAVKGVGGYHLMCDASSAEAIRALRRRKRRPAKPLAVMFPTAGADGLAAVRASVILDAETIRALQDPMRPIVLVPRRADCRLSAELAPGLSELGILLPYSPLHDLLLGDFGAPLVATSGNVSGEPVITDPGDAEIRLGAVADAFLHHDRVIIRPADDPVLRVIGGSARAVRLGRGSAPLDLALPVRPGEPLLALGGHMKVAIGLGMGDRAVLSPHIGDLDSPRSLDVFTRLAIDLPRLHGVTPRRLVCDAHPAYASVRWARRQGMPVMRVQHHAAHASALAAEYPEIERWLVFAWDGAGYGEDGTLWGGEALLGRPGRWRRVASFRPFRPPGGDLAARAPWRSAAALMWQSGRPYHPPLAGEPSRLAWAAWKKGINAPATSAVGRLFDAAAALITGIADTSFEGQAAMELESLAEPTPALAGEAISLPLAEDAGGVLRTDWTPLLDMLTDTSVCAGARAWQFHATMAGALAEQALAVMEMAGVRREIAPFDAVGLTGGVFQNRLLAEAVLARLDRLGIRAFLPTAAPANDGGLAYGQIVEAAARLAGEGNP